MAEPCFPAASMQKPSKMLAVLLIEEHYTRNQALSQLCAFCSPDRRKESANLCYAMLRQLTGRSRMRIAVNRTFTLLCAIALSGIASGQSNKTATPTRTFHVEGTIDDPLDAVIPHVEVHFVGYNADRTVIADDKGFYQTDLPVGTYTMTAAFPLSGPNHISLLTKYVRFFRVPSPMTVTFNGTLYGIYSCDGG